MPGVTTWTPCLPGAGDVCVWVTDATQKDPLGGWKLPAVLALRREHSLTFGPLPLQAEGKSAVILSGLDLPCC